MPELRTPSELLQLQPKARRLKKASKPLVIVAWNDAVFVEGTVQPDEIEHQPHQMYTIGWLLRDDPDGVSVGHEWDTKDNSWRGVTFIPRGMIDQVVKK